MDLPFPLHTTVRHGNLDNVCELVRESARKIARFERVTSCRVTVDMPHRHHRHGGHWQVHIEILGAPGGEIAVSRDSDPGPRHEALGPAIRDAFNAAERLLDQRFGRLAAH